MEPDFFCLSIISTDIGTLCTATSSVDLLESKAEQSCLHTRLDLLDIIMTFAKTACHDGLIVTWMLFGSCIHSIGSLKSLIDHKGIKYRV